MTTEARMAAAEPLDEFDFLIAEPDPTLGSFILDEEFSYRYLSAVRDAARAEKAALRAAKRAAEAAAAEPPAS